MEYAEPVLGKYAQLNTCDYAHWGDTVTIYVMVGMFKMAIFFRFFLRFRNFPAIGMLNFAPNSISLGSQLSGCRSLTDYLLGRYGNNGWCVGSNWADGLSRKDRVCKQTSTDCRAQGPRSRCVFYGDHLVTSPILEFFRILRPMCETHIVTNSA